jgi:hypothetical protein
VGISDGANIEISSSDLKEGAQVATGLATQSAAVSPAAGSPLLPFGGRGFGGNRGAGAGGGASAGGRR